MIKLSVGLLFVGLTLCACALWTGNAPDDISGPITASSSPAEQAQIEAALIGAVTFTGEEGQRPSLVERMAALEVPHVSVAVMQDGNLHWAKAYGEGVDTKTLFQAASLSKAVAAAGIVTLAENRGISLDTDISADLTGLDMATFNPEGLPVTLRGLLSHTNGTTVSGFPGYAVEAEVPTNLQVIMGAEPANTDPVIVKPNPDSEFRYSGGGYQVAQLWAETISGEPFDVLMKRIVLDPIGMTHSTFSQHRQETMPVSNVATAYGSSSSPVEGGWHVYPEQAAAGLWTTPADYTLFMQALIAAANGDAEGGIAPSVTAQIISPVSDNYGLGIGVRDREGELVLTHSGSNRGYRSYVKGLPSRGDVIVAMTNAASGIAVIRDILRTADIAYQWPGPPLVERVRAPVTDRELRQYVGAYALEGKNEPRFDLVMDGTELVGTTPSGYTFSLIKIGDLTFIDPDDAEEVTFSIDEVGEVTLQTQRARYTRLMQP